MTSIFGRVFRWDIAPQDVEPLPEMPPRPRDPAAGPVTTPRLFTPCGPVDPEFDPTGSPPLSLKGGAK